MKMSRLFSRGTTVFSLVAMAVVAVAALSMPQHKAEPPKTLRLYVFDCGVIDGIDLARMNFKKEELAETRMSIPCYLVAHPKGTLMW